MILRLIVCLSMMFLPLSVSAYDRLPPPVKDKDFYDNGRPDPMKVELGRFLFYDKILSGNKNISCGTCHHSLSNTGDGLSLSVGEGANGLGVTRNTGLGENAVVERVPRNAPPLFNLGAKSFTTMFHDGRVTVDPEQPSGFISPAGDDLPLTLDNVLAAQAMFPVTSGTEMAGQRGENSVADAAADGNLAGPGGVWEQLAERLMDIEEYADMFVEVFALGSKSEITFAHVANAIAAFEAVTWRADNSAFDKFLRGDFKALSLRQLIGMKLFYGKARCSHCHSGTFQSDGKFHSIAMPQIGPGKGDGVNFHEDFGRERVTQDIEDRYRFRTPPLRNVALTGPWGHDGAYNTLRGVLEHHINPVKSLMMYNCRQEPVLPSRKDLDAIDCLTHENLNVLEQIASSNELRPNQLGQRHIDYLLEFLNALTDSGSLDLRADVPKRVPSGLPIVE